MEIIVEICALIIMVAMTFCIVGIIGMFFFDVYKSIKEQKDDSKKSDLIKEELTKKILDEIRTGKCKSISFKVD